MSLEALKVRAGACLVARQQGLGQTANLQEYVV